MSRPAPAPTRRRADNLFSARHIAEILENYRHLIERDQPRPRSEVDTSARRERGQPPVELVQWPSNADRRADLALLGVPRLLVVADGACPPEVLTDEDWCWASADERDVAVRIQHLREMSAVAGPIVGLGQACLLSLGGREP